MYTYNILYIYIIFFFFLRDRVLLCHLGWSAVVPSYNVTIFHSAVFVLLGIPGLEAYHIWLSIPLCLIYITAVLGNSILIVVIVMECNLHEPMYFFLSVLAITDILLSTTTVPKALAIFWLHAHNIAVDACVTQVFFVHMMFVGESAILLAMAFDPFVAFCAPLRYTAVLTLPVVGRIALAIITRSFCIIFPVIFLLKRLPFCRTNIVHHSYCEHIGVARLACDDITVNIWYGFSVPIVMVILDVILIAEAQHKTLSTCGSHLCVILVFYVPSFFTLLTHHFGHNIPQHVHILLANLYVVVPPMLNPIVYGVKTKQICEGFGTLSRLDRRQKHRNLNTT
uniref:Olfactory receptor family 52 subfamily B member 2 n=1 Tax=Piliocolobus tephrosceles TaxID=591936 RepID=A0A8C9M0W7_9PRIM